jgi:two-component system, NarL family, sensor kinase
VNESLFIIFVVGSLLLGLFAFTLTGFLIIHKRRQNRNKMEKQKLEFQHQAELLNTRLEVQEQSMTLISEEIHDNINQILGITRKYLFSAEDLMEDPKGKKLLGNSKELLSKAIKELRHISHSLNSELIQELGLIQFLEKDLEHISGSSQLHCNLEVEGEPYDLAKEQNLLIYRIVQEAVQNVIKHAEAKRISIFLKYEADALDISVCDDGKGFDTEAALGAGSLGLRNLNNRAKLLKSELRISSEADKGTCLKFLVPRLLTHEVSY